jgi:hypothetical protein
VTPNAAIRNTDVKNSADVTTTAVTTTTAMTGAEAGNARPVYAS